MKYAKAMRYGGELIDAADSDYSDFKKLIPLCPECSEPVHLRKESDRVSSLGKEFEIPKHWSHFKSVSEEQKAGCEARVSGYTEEDKRRIQTKARGQRLRLIQKYMETAIRAIPYLEYLDNASSQANRDSEWIANKAETIKIFRNLILSASNSEVSEIVETVLEKAIDGTFPDNETMLYIHSSISRIKKNSEIHSKITSEVLKFLCAKRQKKFLNKLCSYAFLQCLAEFKSIGGSDPSVLSSVNLTFHVIRNVAVVPWDSKLRELSPD